MPAYNEEKRLPQTLREAHTWLLEHWQNKFEIIIVDDGSIDNTVAVVLALQKDMPELKVEALANNRGKGAAVRHGMLCAVGKWRLFMDADHSTNICEVQKVATAMQAGAEMVIASRRHPDSDVRVHQPWLREHMGQIFNYCVRNIGLNNDLSDTQCGFKAFTAEVAEPLFTRQQVDGFAFDVELLYMASKAGLRIAVIPIVWINEENSRVNLFTDPLHMLAELWRIRRNHRHIGSLDNLDNNYKNK
ncbi:MAG: glycosyltransferase family 2 protein [Mariprofundales bacterium]